MPNVRFLSKLVLAVVLVVTVPVSASAQIVLRFAHTIATEDAMHLATVEFAKKVAQRTGNAVQIEVFSGGQLGNDTKILEAVKLGAIDLVMTGNPFFSSFAPEMNVLDLPYLFRDYEHAYKVVDGPIGAELLRAVERNGMKGIGSLEIGFRNVTNSKRPVRVPDDMKGLKIRTTPNPAHLLAFRLLGANPVPMAFTEVYLALKTGTVDGQENPITLIQAMKFYEVQKYLSLTQHAYTVANVVMNAKRYAGLTPDQQKALHKALHEAVVGQRKLNREREGAALAQMRAAGMQIEEHPEREAFRKVVAEPATEEYVKKFGRATIDRIVETR